MLLRMLCAAVVCLLAGASASCSRQPDAGAQQTVDSLNAAAYRLRYVSIDSLEHTARAALDKARTYGCGIDAQHEALCHLAFAAYMRMDYRKAAAIYRRVAEESRNQVLRLAAHVGMMHVCQRRSANKEFYDYRAEAQACMQRVRTEEGDMPRHLSQLWRTACSDFHLVQSTYYYYLRQEEEAEHQLRILTDSVLIAPEDTAQRAYLSYLIGNTRTISHQIATDHLQQMLYAATLAASAGCEYIYSKVSTSLAQDLAQTGAVRPSRMVVLREVMEVPDSVADEAIDLYLCRQALASFQRYGSLFDVSQTYIAISDCLLNQGDPEGALAMLDSALQCVNRHHLMANPSTATSAKRSQLLRTYEPDADSIGLEMQWIHDPDVVCLPEWMADVREQLSIVYSALGLKPQSDYNRNIYLDILDATRQDRRMEQRLDALEREETAMSRTALLAALIGLAIIALLFVLSRRLRHNYAAHYLREQREVEREMRSWRERSDASYSQLADTQEEMEEKRQAEQLRSEQQKRSYIDKATCLSIVHAITPFLDRALRETSRLQREASEAEANGTEPDSSVQQERLQYVGELTERINLYNDILTHWIQVRRGEVSLHIETFALQPLFEILTKNISAFQQKKLTLSVPPTQASVKADRALTLFMMNTLLENARKFTPAGGSVSLSATEGDGYVEISVQDTGRGLSAADLDRITQEKVYDSQRIGNVDANPELRRNKGFGFGLMNCRGIIEKYRKENAVFSVCRFGAESEEGKGSRFFFRLPSGAKRAVLLLALCMLVTGARAAQPLHQDKTAIADSASAASQQLDRQPEIIAADRCADSVYYANIDGRHAEALQWADSALRHLNAYHLLRHPKSQPLMQLYASNHMAEIQWWRSGIETNYFIILDVRNEAAVAALALRNWSLYYYNNEIYTRLYKLMAQDARLDRYADDLQSANTNKRTALITFGAFVVVALLIYFSIYYRRQVLPTFALRQILELSRRIFHQPSADHLADIICSGVNDIRPTEGVFMLFRAGTCLSSAACPQTDMLREVMSAHLRQSPDDTTPLLLENGRIRIYPLLLPPSPETPETDPDSLGLIAFVLHQSPTQDDDNQLLSLIAHYTATNLYYSTLRMQQLHDAIEFTDDERRRAEMEANAVHVQNMVIDNCLSTIKHETMYYPSRMLHIIGRMQQQTSIAANDIDTLHDTTTYYKEIFSLLAACASRQLGSSLFRREHVNATDLADRLRSNLARMARKAHLEISFEADLPAGPAPRFIADRTLLLYLADQLTAIVRQSNHSGRARLQLRPDGAMLRLTFTFDGHSLPADNYSRLFYPETLQYDAANDALLGAQWLILRQIVRQHDENVRRGCRIDAAPLHADGSGISIQITLPQQQTPPPA